MNTLLLLASAFSIGLLGSVHCLGMCGGIAAALSYAVPEQRRNTPNLILYQCCYGIGRITTYALIGALAGGLGVYMAQYFGTTGKQVLHGVASLLVIALGFYISGWWLVLRRLEQLGLHVWKFISPLTRRLMPVTSIWKALGLGILWGWLPCGLVYSTVAWATSSGSGYTGALLMLSFGLGTLPMLLITGTFAGRLQAIIQRRSIRAIAGISIILLGCWQLGTLITHIYQHDTMNHHESTH